MVLKIDAQLPTPKTFRGNTLAVPPQTVEYVAIQSVTLQAGEAVTIDDANYNRIPSSEGNYEAQIVVDGITFSELTFTSLDEDIATVSPLGYVSHVSNGTARILARSAKHTFRIDVPVADFSGETVDIFDSWVDGSLAKHINDYFVTNTAGTTLATNGPQLSSNIGMTGPHVWDGNCWTGIIPSQVINSIELGTNRGGTLIAPDIVMTAAHYGWAVGQTVLLLGSDGTSYTRTIAAAEKVAVLSDTWVSRLDSTVPITPMPVIDKDLITDYMPTLALAAPASGLTFPILSIRKNKTAHITLIAALNLIGGTDVWNYVQYGYAASLNSDINQYWANPLSGDSSHTMAWPINGAWVNAGVYSGNVMCGQKLTEINTSITNIGGGTAATLPDLSAFTNFA